jgi:hypothetical protein
MTTEKKDDDTAEILPDVPPERVSEIGPPIDDPCAGLPMLPGNYSKPGTRHADGSCTIGNWGPA